MKQDTLQLNGRIYTREKLLETCKEKLIAPQTPQWERDINHFIADWLDEKDHIMVHTSGSTGKPKAIALKKSWMEYSARQTCRFFGLDHTHSALLCLPATYIAGRMMIVRAFVSGLNLITTEPAGNPFENLPHPVDFAAITPFQLYQSLHTLKTEQNAATLIVGGGEISPTLLQQIQDLPAAIYATYGMTETSSHIGLKKVNGTDKQETYTVVGDTKVSLDPRGCLVLENALLFDGKLYTNDMVSLPKVNRFRWLGRYDNIINSGGVKIIPEEVEQTIAHLRPETMIIGGLPDDKLGMAVVLFLEKDHITDTEKTLLLAQIKTLVHAYALPRQVRCVARFPKTPTGKIDRKALIDS